MGVDALAQVELDAQRDPPGDHSSDVCEQPAHDHDRGYHDREHQQRVTVVRALRQLPVIRVADPLADRFDGQAGEVRDQHGHDHRDAREHPGRGQPALVGPQEREQSVERGHSCMVNEYRRRRRCRSACATVLLLSLRYARRAEPPAGSPAAGRACATRARIGRRCATRAAPSSRCAPSREWIQLIPVIRGCRCCAVTDMSSRSRDRRRPLGAVTTALVRGAPVGRARTVRASRASAPRRRAAVSARGAR